MSIQNQANIMFDKFKLNFKLKSPGQEIFERIKKGLIINNPEMKNNFERLSKINMLLGLFLSLYSSKFNQLSNEDSIFPLKKKFRNDILKLGSKILKINTQIIDQENKINEKNIEIFQEFFLNFEILLLRLLNKNNSNYKEININDKKKKKKKDKENFEDFSKQSLKFLCDLLTINNKFSDKYKRNLLTDSSLHGILHLLSLLFERNNDNIQMFFKYKGIFEIFKLKNYGNIHFSGLLEEFTTLFEVMIEDKDILSITIEAEIKKFFIDKGKEIVYFEEFIKFFSIKYTKSEQFSEISKKLCIIKKKNEVNKDINLKNPVLKNISSIIELKNSEKDSISLAKNTNKTLIKRKENAVDFYLINYHPKETTIQIISQIISTFITQLEDIEGNNLLDSTTLLNILHILIRKFPILLPFILRFNVNKILKNCKLEKKILINLGNLNNNITFFNFSIRVLPLIFLDKCHHFFFEICLENFLLLPPNNENKNNKQLIPYVHEIRKKILYEIYQILDKESNNDNFLNNDIALHNFSSYSMLLISIFPIRDMIRFSLKEETHFGKIYSEILKKMKLENFSGVNNFLPFILDPLSLLYQYSYILAAKNENNEIISSNLLSSQINFMNDWNSEIGNGLNSNKKENGGNLGFMQNFEEDNLVFFNEDGEEDEEGNEQEEEEEENHSGSDESSHSNFYDNLSIFIFSN